MTYTWHPERDGFGTVLEAEKSDVGTYAEGFRVVAQGVTLAEARERFGAGRVAEWATRIPVTVAA
jgi:hypothetical protein